MKIVVAMDSFKGCMSSNQANETVKHAIQAISKHHEVSCFTMGDGGEGSVDAFVSACNGVYVHVQARDAYFQNIDASYGLIDQGKTAVIEVASVIGLNMRERSERKPLYTTSYGVGQLMLDAKGRGVKKIILALGGSSTNDGGMGMLTALGAKFYNDKREYLKSSAKSLGQVARIDLRKFDALEGIEVIAACDVKNTLVGEHGATYTFGKQKGLFPNQIKKIDRDMTSYANVWHKLGYDISSFEGSGAAGGIGGALALVHAHFESGFQLLRTYTTIDEQIQEADLVITGEGQSDYQTMFGKVPAGVVGVANEYNKPCICVSGALGKDYETLYELGFIGIYSTSDRAMSFASALAQAKEKLYSCVYSIIKTIDYWEARK